MTDLQKLLDGATPGPWGINKYGSIGAAEFSVRPIVASVEILLGEPPERGNSAANARLIAQAPDLAKRVLELEAALSFYADEEAWQRHAIAPRLPCPAVHDAGKKARAALKGGAS